MIIVIMAVALSMVFAYIAKDEGEGLAMFGGILFFLGFIAAICVAIGLSGGRVIDERIALYEDYNQQIDDTIRDMVIQYQGYEKETFENIKDATADTIVTMYPELKTDSLVNSQMGIYVENKKEILALREEKIKLKVLKWWLYFGGKS